MSDFFVKFEKPCKKRAIVYIISVMNDIINFIAPYASIAMLGVLAVFILINMLIGMGRGFKRATLHLIIFVGLLAVAFFVTPFIVNWVLSINYAIGGKTPQQYVDYYSDQMVKFLQQQMGDYIVPFQDYIKEYALAVVIALLNLVIFFALYFVVKIVAWVIYAVVAHFAAPKKDRKGNKLKKYAGWGLLVGAVQGLMLFVIFLVPVNGALGIMNNAMTYQANQQANNSITTQGFIGGGYNYDIDYDIDLSALKLEDVNLFDACKKFNKGLSLYNNVMKSSGLQFVSDQAFAYQLTVRVKDGENINLVHDVNSGIELYFDTNSFLKVVNKLKNSIKSGKLDLTSLTEDDYTVLRNYINKAFDLEMLQVADHLLADLDEIFSTPFGSDETLLAGTDIYEKSLYGMLIKANTTNRSIPYVPVAGEPTPTNYAQYAKGLRSVVGYVTDQKLNLIRNDIINIIDLVEALSSYKVSYEGLAQPKAATEILAQDNLKVQDYLDLTTAKLTEKYAQFPAGTNLVNVLGNRLMQFSLVKIIGLDNFNNLVTYSKLMDNQFNNNQDVKKLVDGLIPMFLGKNAFTHNDTLGNEVQGNWEKLSVTVLDVANVLRNYVSILDDINTYKADFLPGDESTAQAKALLKYLSEKLVIKESDYDASITGVPYSDDIKYQKVNEAVDALYELTNGFPPLKDFLISQLQKMQSGDASTYMQTLIDMLNDSDKAQWQSTMKSIVNVADILNNSALGNLMDVIQNGGATNTTEDLMNAISEMDASTVSEMLTDILDIPEVSNAVQDALSDVLNQVNDPTHQDESRSALESYFVANSEIDGFDATDPATAAKIDEVQTEIGDLQTLLEQFDDEHADKDQLKNDLQSTIEALWNKVGDLLGKDPAIGA